MPAVGVLLMDAQFTALTSLALVLGGLWPSGSNAVRFVGALAAALGASAVNAGIASGAAVGGRAASAYGLDRVPPAALVVCVAALPAVWVTRRLNASATTAGAGHPFAVPNGRQ